MLRGIVICPDEEMCTDLAEKIATVGVVTIARTVNSYPHEQSLSRMVRAVGPHIVFLAVNSLEKAADTVATLEEAAPGVHIVALSRSRDPQVMEALIRSEVREFLMFPLERDKLVQALDRARLMLAKKPPAIESTDLLFSFLPSKAGVGTSTIALNTSVAMSNLPDTKTLLCDFDLNSGMIHFMLKLTHAYSVVDAARRVEELDEYNWQDLVATHKKLELLHSGEFNPEFRLEAAQVRHLLDFARRHYKAICLDLSGNMEQYSLDIMRESKRIFLVCTPEVNALHLARRKYSFLKTQNLGEKVSLLVNRVENLSGMTNKEIQELVGLPPLMMLPNNYGEVQRALTEGTHVDPAFAFGRECKELAHRLLDQDYKPPKVGSNLAAFLSTRVFKRLIPARLQG